VGWCTSTNLGRLVRRSRRLSAVGRTGRLGWNRYPGRRLRVGAAGRRPVAGDRQHDERSGQPSERLKAPSICGHGPPMADGRIVDLGRSHAKRARPQRGSPERSSWSSMFASSARRSILRGSMTSSLLAKPEVSTASSRLASGFSSAPRGSTPSAHDDLSLLRLYVTQRFSVG